jgi:hypothetical protein
LASLFEQRPPGGVPVEPGLAPLEHPVPLVLPAGEGPVQAGLLVLEHPVGVGLVALEPLGLEQAPPGGVAVQGRLPAAELGLLPAEQAVQLVLAAGEVVLPLLLVPLAAELELEHLLLVGVPPAVAVVHEHRVAEHDAPP